LLTAYVRSNEIDRRTLGLIMTVHCVFYCFNNTWSMRYILPSEICFGFAFR